MESKEAAGHGDSIFQQKFWPKVGGPHPAVLSSTLRYARAPCAKPEGTGAHDVLGEASLPGRGRARVENAYASGPRCQAVGLSMSVLESNRTLQCRERTWPLGMELIPTEAGVQGGWMGKRPGDQGGSPAELQAGWTCGMDQHRGGAGKEDRRPQGSVSWGGKQRDLGVLAQPKGVRAWASPGAHPGGKWAS